MHLLLQAQAVLALLLAQPEPESVKPGWLAGVVLAGVAVATYLLWRSMNRQLRKVDFDDGSPASERETGTDRDQPT